MMEPFPTLAKAIAAWQFVLGHSSAWENDTRDITLMAIANQCCALATNAGDNKSAMQWADQATAHAAHYIDRHKRVQGL